MHIENREQYEYMMSLALRGAFVRHPEEEKVVDENAPIWTFDFKKILLQEDFLTTYARMFVSEHEHDYPYQVGGLESGAIPLVTAIVLESKRYGTPVSGFFIRKSRKKTGVPSRIEGSVNEHPIILVDDILHSGDSFLKQLAVLDEERASGRVIPQVEEVSSIIRYRDVSSYTVFHDRKIHVKSFFELNDFTNELGVRNLLPKEERTVNPYPVRYTRRIRVEDPFLVESRTGPSVHEGMLLALGNGVHAFDKHTGEECWRFETLFGNRKGTRFSKPVFLHNTMYLGGRDGSLHALHTETGKHKWSNYDADWLTGAPGVSVKRGVVYAPLSYGLFKKQGSIVALHSEKGNTLWKYPLTSPLSCDVTVSEAHDLLYVGTEDGELHAIHEETGRSVWKKQLRIEPQGTPIIDTERDSLYVTGLIPKNTNDEEKSYIYCLDAKTGEERFVWDEFRFGAYGLTIHAHMLIFASPDETLYVLHKETGTLIWKRDLGARTLTVPTVVTRNGRTTICIGTNGGKLIEYTLDGSLVSETYFGERIVNTPVFDGGSATLFVQLQTGEVCALAFG